MTKITVNTMKEDAERLVLVWVFFLFNLLKTVSLTRLVLILSRNDSQQQIQLMSSQAKEQNFA